MLILVKLSNISIRQNAVDQIMVEILFLLHYPKCNNSIKKKKKNPATWSIHSQLLLLQTTWNKILK